MALIWLTPLANACSYSNVGVQAYHQYHDGRRERLLSDDAFIVVIKTSVDSLIVPKMEKPLSPYSNGETSEIEWRGVKFDVVETIFGKAPKLEAELYPVRERPNIDRLTKHRTKKMGFGYWEVLPLSFPVSHLTGGSTSCGFFNGPIFDPGMTYLMLGRGDRIEFAEPVKNKTDVYVDYFRNIVSGSRLSKLKMTPQSYFSNLKGYVHIRFDRCEFGEFYFPYGEEKNEGFSYTVLDSSMSDAPEIKLMDIISYPPTRQTPHYLCKTMNEVLVLINDTYPVDYSNGMFGVGLRPLPTQRFLPVTAGAIETKQILTNIDISGANNQPVDQVKYWIGSD